MSTGASQATLAKINTLIKNEDDVADIEKLITDIRKEKTTIDSQLALEQERHLSQIHTMISKMQTASKSLSDLKYSFEKLEDLRKDNLMNTKEEFQVFDKAALALKNINAVEKIYEDLSSFDTKCGVILQVLDKELLKDENDELSLSTGDNILIAHYELTKLRDSYDNMVNMSQESRLSATKQIVSMFENKLSQCINKFDHLLGIVVDSILDFVGTGNFGYLIKVVKIIQYEEKEDLKVRLWSKLLDSKSEEDDIADNKLLKVNRFREREYKSRFELMIEKSIKDVFHEVKQANDVKIFLGEEGDFYYSSLVGFKVAVDKCFPKEWDFFPKILKWHQDSVREIIDSVLSKESLSNAELSEVLEVDYDNKKKLKKLFKLNVAQIKALRLVPEEKRKQLLNNSLQENINSTTKWVETALKKSIAKFESLSEEPSDRKDDRLSFQVAQDIMLILSSNTKSIRILMDASVLVQYFTFFANDIMKIFQEHWIDSLDKMCIMWINSRNDVNVNTNPNIGYLPRYITNLSNDCLILTDALERDFDLITEGLSEVHTTKLHEMKQVATNHSIELGTYCLQKLSTLAYEDYSPIMNELFTKNWYKSSTIIDNILQIIDQEYLLPFIDFSYPELLISLFDFITDDFILAYMTKLNYCRKFEDKIVETLERDGHKIMDVLGKHDEDGILENKMIIFDVLIELILADNDEEIIDKWNTALLEIHDLPVDFLHIVLDCKKYEKSKITFLVNECEELCKQSRNENIDKPANAIRKFHYSPSKK
ncbi:hypothetical protein CANINC_002790 [Pichia inconspicua]|uniref:Uncharacterized protein n=1 Tax=Pichia inconspicua TaxID=52247 RepID=A0A4T0X0S2_9ASCO|nr:hypothetical protein CANINC_002790 [[Candida] inconspicua]